jgi:hypothetical protein
VVILTGLSSGLAAKPKLLKRSSVIEENFVPSPVPAELCRSLRRLAANMSRLWFSQDSLSQPTTLETLRSKPLH